MTWGFTSRGRTPAMIRTDHGRSAASAPARSDPAARPAQGAAGDDRGDGFADWMAHVDAGRIAVG